jgi:hypothetical protein
MRTLTTTFPLETETESNAKGHWRPKAERAKKQRSDTFFHTHAVAMSLRTRLKSGTIRRIEVTLTRISPRELDDDNLASALKHVRDGVADALGVDDRDRRISWRCEQASGGRDTRAVRIDLTLGIDDEVQS